MERVFETATPAPGQGERPADRLSGFQGAAWRDGDNQLQQLWKPGSSDIAQKGVLVQVYDVFTDHMTSPSPTPSTTGTWLETTK